LQEVGRSRVQPAFVDLEVARDAIARVFERVRKGLCGNELARDSQGDDVDILRRATDKPKREQRRTFNRDQLEALSGSAELLGER
jgi:hypothetical protein